MERSTWPKNLSSSRKHAIKELLHAQNPTKKLRDLFDAHSQTGDNTGQPLFAEDLIVNALRSFSNTLSESMSAESDEVSQVPTNACVMSVVSDASESINTPVPRKTSNTRRIPDLNWINEGHQGRTSDQKSILNSKLSRESRIDGALKLQMEVQKRLKAQLEVQKALQMRIEAQGKHLKALIEAQKSLSLDGSDPANPECARAQIVDLNLAISNFVDPARGGGGVGGERNNSNIINTMMGTKEEMHERGGPQNHGSASQIYDGEAATFARSSSNPPQLFLDLLSPGDDSIPLSFNSNPVFFDFLSVHQEQ